MNPDPPNGSGTATIQGTQAAAAAAIGQMYGGTVNIGGQPSSPTSLHQLPSPPSDFTGRTEELSDLLHRIQNGQGLIISAL